MSVGGLWGPLGFVLGRVWGIGEQLSISDKGLPQFTFLSL